MPQLLLDEKKILFLSDAHLGGFTEAKERETESALIKLIDYAQENHFRIAILGDLFDYWMEYPHYTPPLGKNVLQRFQEFHQTAPATLYISGNHDYWTLGHFAKRGFDVEPDYRIWRIQAGKTLLLHGDAIGNDLQHLKRPGLHQLLRNSLFLWFYRTLLPAKTGLWVMKKVAQFSRFAGSGHSTTQRLNQWAKQTLENTDINFILAGHDHCPRIHNYPFGTYINLGTFHHHRTLAAYTNKQLGLVCWNSTARQLIPFEPQQPENE